MKIIIAGSGCIKCQTTEKNTMKAVSELRLDATVEHCYDVREFSKMGVRLTPAVLVDGRILFSGKVPSVDEIKAHFA